MVQITDHQNDQRRRLNYINTLKMELINVENFNKNIPLAIKFDRTQINHANKPFFSSNLKLNLPNSEKDSTTKSTKEYTKQSIEEEINKLFSKVKALGAGVDANLSLKGVDLGAGINIMKKKSKNNVSTKFEKNLIKLSNKDNTLWTRYTKKFTMPPKIDSLTTNQILSHEAIIRINEIKDLRTAQKYVEDFGSHYLETTYHLGGYYAEEIDASLDEFKNKSTDNIDQKNQKDINATAKLNILNIGVNREKSSNTNETINKHSSISKANINKSKITSVGSALTPIDFLKMLDENIYESKIMDSDRETILEEFSNLKNKQKRDEFKRYFKPIWEYLSDYENDGSPNQKRIFLMIKIICIFFERLFFFCLEFEKNYSSRNDENLVSKYLNSLESYFFKKLESEFASNENIDIEETLAAIFSAELNQNWTGIHKKFLDKLDYNQIKFAEKVDSFASLTQEHPYKCWYMAFYNQKFQTEQNEKWHNTLEGLISRMKSSSKNKCAVFDCDLHAEKKFEEKYAFDKVYRLDNDGLKEDTLLKQDINSNLSLPEVQCDKLSGEIILKFDFYNRENEEIKVVRYFLQSINLKTFSSTEFSSLKRLDLSNNFINSLEPNQFQGLVNLNDLNLANNRIEVILRRHFRNLKNLRFLNLGENLISNIENRAFVDLVELWRIDLNKNKIDSVEFLRHCDKLEKLEFLDISDNKLKILENTQNTYLTHLHCYRNYFEEKNHAELKNIRGEVISIHTKIIPKLHGGEGIYALKYDPESKFLFSGGGDGILKIRKYPGNNEGEIRQLKDHHGGKKIYCLQYDPKLRVLFSGGQDGNVKIIKFRDDQLIEFDLVKLLPKHHHNKIIYCLKYDPESRTLFSGGGDGSIKIIKFRDDQLETFDKVPSLYNHLDGKDIYCLQYDHKSRTLFSGGEDKIIKIIKFHDNQLKSHVHVQSLEGQHGSQIWSLQYDQESKTLFSGGSDGNIKIIKFTDGFFNNFNLVQSLDKHHDGCGILSLKYDQESKTLFSGSDNGDLKIYPNSIDNLIRSIRIN